MIVYCSFLKDRIVFVINGIVYMNINDDKLWKLSFVNLEYFINMNVLVIMVKCVWLGFMYEENWIYVVEYICSIIWCFVNDRVVIELIMIFILYGSFLLNDWMCCLMF